MRFVAVPPSPLFWAMLSVSVTVFWPALTCVFTFMVSPFCLSWYRWERPHHLRLHLHRHFPLSPASTDIVVGARDIGRRKARFYARLDVHRLLSCIGVDTIDDIVVLAEVRARRKPRTPAVTNTCTWEAKSTSVQQYKTVTENPAGSMRSRRRH
jgi:hypothetical protein